MIFEYNGVIKIDDGLELENPKMEIMSVFYDLKKNDFDLEIHFWELKNRHSRMFNFSNPNTGSLDMNTIISFTTNDSILGKFSILA